MKIVLLQARDDDDPMLRHEVECFEAGTGLASEHFRTLNLAHVNPHNWSVDDADIVMVGGSGDYSVAKGGFEWHRPMLDLMHHILAERIPMFASCFGFQVLVQALGGAVESVESAAEVGTFHVTLNEAGIRDSLFGHLPSTFDANLGHNDSATDLPDGLVPLASSERCQFQAVRLVDRPVWATQFHPELTMEDNMVRYKRYLTRYAPNPMSPEQAHEEALKIHRPTPDANGLLKRFLEAL